jgi:orotate phosphoribosyltransferase
MAREAGAEVLGAGFVVEKRFKHGREYIESLHVPVSTLAQVERLENGGHPDPAAERLKKLFELHDHLRITRQAFVARRYHQARLRRPELGE